MEPMLPRLLAAAKQFNVGQSTLISFFRSHGIDEALLKPTAKLTPHMLALAKEEFRPDLSHHATSIRSYQPEPKSSPAKVNSFRDIGKIIPTPASDSDQLQSHGHRASSQPVYRGRPSGKPIIKQAAGRVKFFDYLTNKFGIIERVVTKNGHETKTARISENGIKSTQRLNQGDWIFFTLSINAETRQHSALEAVLLTEADENILQEFISLIRPDDVLEIAGKLKTDTKRQLSMQFKQEVARSLLINPAADSWVLVNEWGDESSIEQFRKIILSKDTVTQLPYLQRSFDRQISDSLVSSWQHTGKQDLLTLLKIIGKPNKYETLPQNLIESILSCSWSFGELSDLYRSYPDKELHDLLIDSFNFLDNDVITNLEFLFPGIVREDLQLQRLQNKLRDAGGKIIPSFIIDIYIKFGKYNLIESENRLLSLLLNRDLSFEHLSQLVLNITGSCDKEKLIDILKKNKGRISQYNIEILLRACFRKIPIAKLIFDICVSSEGEQTGFQDDFIYDILESDHPLEFRKLVLRSHYKRLPRYPVKLLKVAQVLGEKLIQAEIYKLIDFQTEKELIDIIKALGPLNLDQAVTDNNRPLKAFTDFMESIRPVFTESVRTFLKNHSSTAEIVLIKYLICLYHKKHLRKPQLLSLTKTIQWRSVSAMIIAAFIEESEYPNTLLISKLSSVFISHFGALQNSGDDLHNVDNFRLSGILNDCDGRKKYTARFWQRNGVSRWYSDSPPSIIHEETLDCFCEGRTWKKDKIWDSATNLPMEGEYEFYWCRNAYCAKRNDVTDLTAPYQHWTLQDIAEICGINIEKMALATLAGWANRMNQIIERLFCRECNHILRPTAAIPRILGYYAVPTFHCINKACIEHNKVIRFTHCLNGKCESHVESNPLDSRDCENCNPLDRHHTGMRCNYCGQPCPQCSGGHHTTIVEDRW